MISGAALNSKMLTSVFEIEVEEDEKDGWLAIGPRQYLYILNCRSLEWFNSRHQHLFRAHRCLKDVSLREFVREGAGRSFLSGVILVVRRLVITSHPNCEAKLAAIRDHSLANNMPTLTLRPRLSNGQSAVISLHY